MGHIMHLKRMKFQLLVFITLCSLHTTADTPSATFNSEDIFELEYVSDAQISPDGAKIIYTRHAYNKLRDTSRRNLWIYDVKRKSSLPLFADQYNYSSAVWAPDSQRFAFVSNQSGTYQIYVHWLAQNQTALISSLDKSVRNLTWSPDGNQLAFTMQVSAPKSAFAKSVKLPSPPKGATWSERPLLIERARYQADGRGMLKPMYRHIFVIPAIGGTETQITTANYQHFGPLTWTPDSKAIVFNSNQSDNWEYEPNDSDLYQIDVSNLRLTKLTQRPGAEFNPKFSPDGKTLAYLTRTDAKVPYQNTELVTHNLSSGKTTVVSRSFDRSIAQYAWRGNKDFIILYDDRGLRLLATLTRSGKLKSIVNDVSGITLGRPYTSGQFSSSSNGAIAYTQGNAQKPADLGYVYRGKSSLLTEVNADLLGRKQLGQVNAIEYKSSFDGEMIQGWYITPPGFDKSKKYPLLLEIHGGPHLAYGPHFSSELQRYAAEGYVVFYANHRGSSSYGERFAMLLEDRYSSVEDFADHNSGVDAMIKLGFIDSEQLFIAGGSAGGIASAYAIGLTDRFKAAVITKPVINWVSKVLTADSYLGQIRNQFPGLPWEHLEHYWKRSPLSLVGNVTTPSLIMTGENDRRTPMSESEQFYQALKLKKVDAALVRIPGASHGIAGRPSRMISKIEYTIAWLNKYRSPANKVD